MSNFVNGQWRPATSGETRTNVNPGDLSDIVGEFAESGAADVTAAVDAAHAAWPAWRELGPIKRAAVLTKAQAVLAARGDEVAAAITREQGKRLGEARGEVDRALAILEFTAGEARRLNGVTTPAEEARTIALTFRKPIGVVGLVTPWNFPLAIPMWKVAPALLAGCTAVLKPSPFTPLTAQLLVEVFAEAGTPDGVLNLIQGDREAGEALVADERVAGISFTGSLAVGRAIHVGGANRLLRTQLELGGKNALIVLDDADLDKAVAAIIHGAFGQSGQRCSATSRVVVDVRVKEELLARLHDRVSAMRVGIGTDPAADIGPVVNQERLDACLAAVEGAVAVGAKVVCGGERAVEGLPEGYYVTPTVLRDVPWDSEIAQEEVFGPVLSVVDCDGFDDAMRISNSVKYGMSGTIFTQNPARMFEALDQFEAGMLHVNRPGVGAYAHLPHMGSKMSQYGAPECSPQVWDFYTEWRSACITY
ncbi:aldehyde dehydrogenase (NAD+) [Actinokineospora alba]|uniref:Aldehyde dehydrogenase (NAD+) n=1 Tax=Actinokineospora alba TaxID=504798 RepID=A0A1H0W2K7_9PSEU|nr:aldehyde dehydrogenase family protein [Actinokineospora alba]TDP67783.1 aldehyde dehydrogenase (NAD+) [Actinokineospora alba]SDI71789.1 aldehyde dehydrogenase (NAD+) [Actinokineospora alba]SDP84731.1 aldehyde dehydrogenase (NAD+) [Actinokineospora alba]